MIEISPRDFKLLRHGDEDEAREFLQQLLLNVAQQAVEDALRLLPNVTANLLMRGAHLKGLSDEFYDKHKDLKDHKQLVAQVLEKVDAQHPGKKFEELLTLAAAEAKKKLRLSSGLSLSAETKPKLDDLDHLAGMFE